MSQTPPPDAEADFRSVLASVDRRGRRRWIYAAVVNGVWRRRRTTLSALLIVFYCAIPFLRVGGEPFLRFDIPQRHYIVLGHTFWPQDFFFLLLGVLAVFISTLLLVSLFGRVFCGWLCPHNVFLEQVYRRVEAWCEGPAHRRALQDANPLKPGSLRLRKAAKWILYVLITGALANATTALFIGTESFRGGVLLDPAVHPAGAVFFAAAFAAILFNFTWFREQTCTIVCPYGRWQSALLDADTLGVTYDAKRGEPRGKKGSTTGDCVDCHQCVAVCPTGIDIRNGNQLECIHCTACIDACDAVMTKLGRPTGLIRYASEKSVQGAPLRIVRPRGAIYAAALLTILTIATVLLVERKTVLVTHLRDTQVPLVVTGSDGAPTVQSHVHLALVNRSRHARSVSFDLPPELQGELFTQFKELALPPNERREQTLILRVPQSRFPVTAPMARKRMTTILSVTDDRGERSEIPLTLEAP